MNQAPPHSLDAERSVLGSLLLHVDAVADVRSLAAADFYLPKHQIIYRAILSAAETRQTTDTIVVEDELRRLGRLDEVGGREQLLDLLESVVSAAGVDHHAKIVREHAQRRRILEAARRIALASAEGADTNVLRDLLLSAVEQSDLTPRDVGRHWRTVAGDPPIQWLVEGLLPRGGLAVLAGDPGAGKTLLALDLALRGAHGHDWFGRSVAPHSTLVLAGEGSLGPRLRAWDAAHPSATSSDNHYVRIVEHVPDLSSPRGVSDLRRLVAESARAHGRNPDVLIIDTLARATPGLDESDAGAVGLVVQAVATVQREHGCLVTLVHHTRKPGAERGAARSQHDLRGSSAIAGAADAVLLATASGDLRTLRVVKMRDGEAGAELAYSIAAQRTGWSLDDGRAESAPVVLPAAAEIASTPPDASLGADADVRAIVCAVAREGGVLTTRDGIARAAGLRASRGRDALDRAIASGQVILERRTDGRTTYAVPSRPASPGAPIAVPIDGTAPDGRDGPASVPPSPPRRGDGTADGQVLGRSRGRSVAC